MFYSLYKSRSLYSAKPKTINEQQKHGLLFFLENPSAFSVVELLVCVGLCRECFREVCGQGISDRNLLQRCSQRPPVVFWDFEVDLCSLLNL